MLENVFSSVPRTLHPLLGIVVTVFFTQKRPSLLFGIAFLILTACQSQQSTTENPEATRPPREESQLILNNATLEQANIKGEILWKIQVESAVYTPDKRKANLTKVRGNLLENGKVVLQVSADRGEISGNGENILLRNNVVAVDPRNRASLHSDGVEWRPQQSLLSITQPLKAKHKELDVTAQQAHYNTKEQQLILKGNITAIAPDPQLKLEAEALRWELPKKKVFSDRPLKVARYKDKNVTDELDAQTIAIDLAQKIATTENPVNYKSIEPPVQARSEVLRWDYKNRILYSAKPIQLVQYRDRMEILGNQGTVNFGSRMAVLENGTQGRSERKSATLYAQTLNWNMDSQYVEAKGNVIYQQNDPKFNLTGERAHGVLDSDSVTVEGNHQDRVVTEIFPRNP